MHRMTGRGPSSTRIASLRGALVLGSLVMHLGVGRTLPAQFATHFLSDRRGLDPVSSEVRSSTMKVVLASYRKYAFQQDSARNIGMDLSAGRELPVLWVGTAAQDIVPVVSSRWYAGLWLPVSFHMLWDLNDPSAAIVNTDYRFGAILKAVRGIRALGFHEVGVRLTPFMHESTHLGDELTIAARRRYPDTFERINVSFNFGEVLLSAARYASEVVGSTSNEQVRIRAGFSWLWSDGFYHGDTTETRGGRIVHGSARRVEPIVQGEWVLSRHARQSDPSTWQPFISLDARRRIVFDYEKASSTALEAVHWSWNTLLGLRRAGSVSAAGVAEGFLRVYHGVNPAGQFRNEARFWLVGVGIGLAF